MKRTWIGWKGGLVGVGLALAAAVCAAADGTDDRLASAAHPYGHARRCPCPQEQPAGESAVVPGVPAPALTPPETAGEERRTAPPDALAGSFGATAGPQSAAPNMIGDFSGLGGLATTQPDYSEPSTLAVPIAGGDRRFKVSDDNNPIPTDRIFFDYNRFSNSMLGSDGVLHDLNRFTFGLEKTFLEGLVSLELRVPFVAGLNSVQSFEPNAGVMASEFGNVPLAFKCLALQTERNAVGIGVAAIFPTAQDAHVRDAFGQDLLVVRNESVHLQPFIGWLWTPNDKWFFMAFGQIDFDTSGNDVLTRSGPGLVKAGVYQDQNLGYTDLKIGRWVYRNPAARRLTGIAPTVELHYTTTLQDTDSVAGVTNPYNRVDVLDLTGGLHIEFCQRTTLTVAATLPLRQGSNRVFDSEAMVQLNRRF